MADTTSAAPSLLPCPFCGGVPSIKHGKIFNSIVCPPGPCKGTGLVFAFDFGEEETSRAIAAWNRRVPQPVAREPLTDEQVEAAAKMLAQCMDYPWGCMPDKGRAAMREHARKVVAAACHHVEKGGA